MNEAGSEQWKTVLGRDSECPDLLELLQNGADAGRSEAHRASCLHCQAELALAASFHRAPAPGEQKAVDAIASRLRSIDWVQVGEHGLTKEAEPWWRRWFQLRLLAPASVALACSLVVFTAIQLNRGTVHKEISVPESEAVRSGEVELLSPSGPISSVPQELSWQQVSGAASYQVRLMEVDKTIIWESKTQAPVASLPAGTLRRIVPGKRLLWEVTALSPAGTELARSETRNFTLNLH